MASRGLAKFQSIISTRSRNKDAHPGTVDAAPKRRSPEEMQKIRAKEARTLKEKEQNDISNIKAVAEVEDQLRREDIQRRATNRLASGQPSYRPDHPEPTDPSHEGSSDASEEEYLPEKGASDEDDGESEVDVADEVEEESDNQPKAKKGRKPKLGRADVKAVRQVTSAISSIAPLTDAGKRKARHSDEPQVKKKTKNTNQAPSGLIKGWDSSRKTLALSSAVPDPASSMEDDSMVRPGGLINDFETDDVERNALELKANRKKIFVNPIKITSMVTTAQPTKKALRGGSRKWKLSHLPVDTQDLFSNTLVPFAKIKAGTLAPWDSLETSQIQDLVDVVFPGEGHVVLDEDVWSGLITYRLSNWRNAFLTHASEAVSRYMDDRKDVFPNGASDVAEFVGLYLDMQGTPPTAPFHWREWTVDETGRITKKGRFQHPLIMYTLAHAHFSEYDEIPDPRYLEEGDLPCGALILALQAVEHALKSWLTGSFVEDKTPKGYFSADRYVDKVERKQGQNGRKKDVVTKRAGQYIPTVKSLRQEQWVTIFETATNILDGSKKKKKSRSKSVSSRASSDNLEVEDDIPDYVVFSDED